MIKLFSGEPLIRKMPASAISAGYGNLRLSGKNIKAETASASCQLSATTGDVCMRMENP